MEAKEKEMRPLNTFGVQFLIRQDKEKNGKVPVYARITVNGELTHFALKQWIEPKYWGLTSAHNFSVNGLQIYHFLCDLQFQEIHLAMTWNWSFLSQQEFLPRVKYNGVILTRARWQIPKTKLYFFSSNEEKDWLVGFAKLKDEIFLPEYVVFADSDNELLLDINNLLCIKLVRKAWLKKRKLFLQNAWIRKIIQSSATSKISHMIKGLFKLTVQGVTNKGVIYGEQVFEVK